MSLFTFPLLLFLKIFNRLSKINMIYRSIHIKLGNIENYLKPLYNKYYYLLMFSGYTEDIENELDIQPVKKNSQDEIFFKLREAIAKNSIFEKSQITFDTKFEDLFPNAERRKQIKKLQKEIGFSITLLKPKPYLNILPALVLLVSTIALFLNGLVGLVGIGISMILFYVIQSFADQFAYETVGQVAEKICIDHQIYSKN
jgi:hypothetical protein